MENINKYDLFLGGTCGNSHWREKLIPLLESKGITYFNPVVAEWNETAQKREEEAKQNSRYMLFVITDPDEQGQHISPYSLVEAAIGVCRHPDRTIVCFLLTEDMPKHLQSALKKIQQDLQQLEGARICDSLEGVFKMMSEKQQWHGIIKPKSLQG